MAWSPAAGTFTPTYRDLNPGTGLGWKGWPAGSGQPTLPIRGSQLQKMGPVVPARCKEQEWVLRVRRDMGQELWLVF